MIDRILILSVFIVASCGLAYELIAGALSSYLVGDSVLQFSSIIGCYLFAMGVGAHLSKYVRDEDVLARGIGIRFNGVERTTVDEYCVSEGWVKLSVGNARDRYGRPMTIKQKGNVEPYFKS